MPDGSVWLTENPDDSDGPVIGVSTVAGTLVGFSAGPSSADAFRRRGKETKNGNKFCDGFSNGGSSHPSQWRGRAPGTVSLRADLLVGCSQPLLAADDRPCHIAGRPLGKFRGSGFGNSRPARRLEHSFGLSGQVRRMADRAVPASGDIHDAQILGH